MPLFSAAQVLLKLQAANNLQRALKWVSFAPAAAAAAAAATAAAVYQMPSLMPWGLLLNTAAHEVVNRSKLPGHCVQGGPGERRVCRGLLAVRAVLAVDGRAGGGPEGGTRGA